MNFGRVFLAGESAGANIAHYVAVQAGANKLVGPNIVGSLVVHPYFGRKETDKMDSLDNLYGLIYPTGSRSSDPIIYPELDPNLSGMAGAKVLLSSNERIGPTSAPAAALRQ